MPARRLTTAQAIVKFLLHQYVERDGRRHQFFAGTGQVQDSLAAQLRLPYHHSYYL